jgi:hypothetical protein
MTSYLVKWNVKVGGKNYRAGKTIELDPAAKDTKRFLDRNAIEAILPGDSSLINHHSALPSASPRGKTAGAAASSGEALPLPADVVAAIEGCLAEGEATGAGWPKIPALAKRLGRPVSTEERDTWHAAYMAMKD